MERVIDSVVLEVLNSLDRPPIAPTKEELFLAFLICKTLSDLCETGRAIVADMESRKIAVRDLPQQSNIETCQHILRRFYSESMFIDDPDLGHRPNWNAILSFDRTRSMGAYKIYRAIRRNIVGEPSDKNGVSGKQIQNAIKYHDIPYFVNNFDVIFANIPEQFKGGLSKFKNFVASKDVLKEHQDYVWDFFESLLEIYLHEAENIKDLQTLPSKSNSV